MSKAIIGVKGLPLTPISVFNPPSPYVPKWFEDELKKLGPFRIVWGGTERQFANGRMRIKYLKSSKKVATGWETYQDGQLIVLPLNEIQMDGNRVGRLVYDWVDKGHERFYLEELIHPDIACDGWEAARYKPDYDTGEIVDVLGPAPREGLWKRVICIQDNDGNYMPPNETTLQWIRIMLRLQSEHPIYGKVDPRERPSPNVIESWVRMRYNQIYEQEQEDIKQMEENIISRLQ